MKNDPIAYLDEKRLKNTETYYNLPQETLDLYDSEWIRLMIS